MATRRYQAESMGTSEKDAMAQSIAATNPAVNLNDVSEALRMLRKLRAMGLTGSEYNVRSPYGPSATHSASEGAWAPEPDNPG